MSQMLDEGIIKQLKDLFADLDQVVEILYFGSQTQNCQYCKETQQLLEEVTDITDKAALQIYDIDEDGELADKYAVDKVPGFVVVSREGDEITDYGIRFYGIPSGHEFTSLVTGLMMVSKGDSGLSEGGRAFLAGLKQPVHLQVYVTPT